MRRSAWAIMILGIGSCFCAGCAGNSLVLKGQLEQAQQQQLALSRQKEELQARINALDQDNQRLQSLLAQSRQRSAILEDQLAVLREQLAGVTAQLARVQQDKEAVEQQSQALSASMRRSGSISITPNSSLLANLPQFSDPQIQVRRDGDIIRVEIPAERLFEGQTANLRPDGRALLESVSAELSRSFPKQLIGIEGHVDSEPLPPTLWRNGMHLATAWAITVYEVVLQTGKLRPEQLFVVGHGANHPLLSNASPQGKLRNRRIEFAVYPESI